MLSLALTGGSSGSTPVEPGIEVLLARPLEALAGKRVGLITNPTGVDRRGRSSIDLLAASPHFRLVALFSPEHGLRGTAGPGEAIVSGRDEKTGLPVFSLYGADRQPTPRMLEGVDALLFDVQDIGARPYTYISTMALAMQAAAQRRIPFVVLDRPNPIGGTIVEGNVLDPAFASFVGMYPVAMRHGMTVGELARLFNGEFNLGAQLTVVPVQGWRRELWFDATALPWVNPSPNIRRLEAALHYPGTVLLEATNLSEGRGTELPFEQTGAPWLRAAELAEHMRALGLPGVRFEPVAMTVAASADKFPGQTIPGVRLVVTDRATYRPVSTALLLIDLVRRLHPREFRWAGADAPRPGVLWFERLAGSGRVRPAIEGGTLRQLLQEWESEAQRFRARRQRYLLYP